MLRARRMTRQESLGGEFRRFLVAAASSNLGDGIRLGAMPLLAITLTDDARLIGLVSASAMLPWLLLGPLGGAVVDRGDRRRLMIAGQLGRAGAVAMLVALLLADAATIWWVVGVAFALGCGEVIVDSSSQAAVPQLVRPDQLDRANSQLITAGQRCRRGNPVCRMGVARWCPAPPRRRRRGADRLSTRERQGRSATSVPSRETGEEATSRAIGSVRSGQWHGDRAD